MATRYVENKIREARLLIASPQQVVVELGEYGAGLRREAVTYGDESLERALLGRKDPLIHLALAQHAADEDVLRALYEASRAATDNDAEQRYLDGLRVAVLANDIGHGLLGIFPMTAIGEAEFARLMAEGSDCELTAILANPTLSAHTIAALYKGEGPFSSLSDERRRRCVLISSENPRLTKDKSDEHGPDLGFWDLHKAILSLLGSAPVTLDWLVALHQLLLALDPGHIAYPSESIAPILARWASLQTPEEDSFREGFYTQLELKEEFRCLVAALYGRFLLPDNKRLENVGAADSPDVALRCSYYGRGSLTLATMAEGFKCDGDAYAFAALNNSSVFYDTKLRALLEREHLSGSLIHIYRRRCDQIHRSRPSFDPRPVSEWLQEEDTQTDNEELRSLKRAATTLDEVSKGVETLKTWTLWGFILVGVALLFLRY